MTAPEQDYAALHALAEDHQRQGGQPGLAYGIVAGGRLVHAGGTGQRWPGGPAPDAGTVFRIASMTKSFTAAAVLALRDDGMLGLDDPASDYVPQLRGLRLPTADSPPVSLRHLLTMTAGFPADDPWGDRQQGLPLAEFDGFLTRGVSFAWAPGTRFEYSNLGYAILGRVITAASGQAYPAFVSGRLLRPLGLAATGFEAAEFQPGVLARGYRRGAGGWTEEPPDPCGAFAPMGGVFSCVADLARWVCGLADAFPPGEATAPPGEATAPPGEATAVPHPLRRATRREMQVPQAVLAPTPFTRLPGGPAAAGPVGYGFGLFAEEDITRGVIISHSGGYPGFGSHMRWHPATGTGVIVLANGTYAPARVLASKLLDAVLAQRGRASAGGARPVPPALAPAPGGAGGPWHETLAARDQVMGLLDSWDDTAAERLFSPNVALDEPFTERRRSIEVIRERIGGIADHPARPPEFDTPAHCRWWLRGAHGEVMAEIRLTPQRPPRVQSLTLAVPPAAGSALARAIAALVSVLNGGDPDCLSSLTRADSVDTGLLSRRLRMAGAWAGRSAAGAWRAGDGDTSATVEIDGEHARLIVSVVVDGAGVLQQADIMLAP